MKNFFEDSRFLYGASVAPYAKSSDWPAEEYEQDMKELEKLNRMIINIKMSLEEVSGNCYKYIRLAKAEPEDKEKNELNEEGRWY